MAHPEQESSVKILAREFFSAWKKIAANLGRPNPLEPEPPNDMSLNSYVLWQTYILMAVTGLGYLALTWSTVVLLGGFVTALGKKDFWCLTVISMLQASRIFNDLQDSLAVNFVQLYLNTSNYVYTVGIIEAVLSKFRAKEPMDGTLGGQLTSKCDLILCFPVICVTTTLVLPVLFIYQAGFIFCVALSSWRIVQRDYGSDDRDGSKANLMPALDIFYTLVLCQGVLSSIWFCVDANGMWRVSFLLQACKFPVKWGSISVSEYLMDTRAKCWRDPASIHGRKLINYAVDLLDSESQQDYLSGARMVDTFIKLDADVRSLILPSRPKIQKLIDTLGWRSSNTEIRELAARIVAYLAADIHLTQFPGAIGCISSLFDTTLPYWNSKQGHNHCPPESRSILSLNDKERLIHYVRMITTVEGDAQEDEVDSSMHGSHGDGWNELILQGMAILEKLASDQHNCSDICSTPGLLPKIMAPLHSETLIQDIGIDGWANIVNGSFKVVHRLIRVPEWTGRKLHSEISSSKHAVSNLEKILDGNIQELQMRAIEILTELTLDVQSDLTIKTRGKLIEKQLQIFLTDGQQEEHATTKRLKETAGRTLALLSKTATMSVLMAVKYEDIVEILDAKNKIIYRTIAAQILESLCSSHHKMDKEHVKDILLPKVLRELLTSPRESPTELPQSNSCTPGDDVEIQELSAPGDDEEKQLSERKGQIKSPDQANEEQTAMVELQEAFLSLTWAAICNELISTDDFNVVALRIVSGAGEFVGILKAIVDKNCEAKPDCLRIMKHCAHIAISMMHQGEYIAHFKDQEFMEALSKASRIMSNLESCMLFVGTDRGAKKTVGKLLPDLVKQAQVLVA